MMTFSIRTKLLLSFGVILALMTAVGGAGWWYTTALLGRVHSLFEDNVQAGVQLSKAQEAMWQMRYSTPQFMVLGAEARAKIIANEPKWRQEAADAMQVYAAGSRTPEERELLQEWDTIFTAYMPVRPRWFELYGAGKIEEAAEWRAKELTPRGAASVKTLGRLIELQQQVGAEQHRAAEAAAEAAKRVQLLLLGVALALGIAVACYMAQRLAKPLAQMAHAADKIAAGDMEQRVDCQSRDEMGLLAHAFNNMAANWHQMFTRITASVAALHTASGDLSTLSQQMAQTVSHASEQSTSAAAAAKTMSANMTSVAVVAEQASSNIQTVAATTDEMTTTIGEIARNTEKARQVTVAAVTSVTTASHCVDELGQAATEISQVTDVIMDIAEQTKLLALNATIEAARAGEAGKGFAVVANEVKELATQTNSATEYIRTKIEAMQRSTTSTVAEITQINQVMNDINDLVASIASAVEEQTITTRDIANNVGQIATGITEMMGTVQQAATVSDTIAAEVASVSQANTELEAVSAEVHHNASRLAMIGGELKGTVGGVTF